MKHDYTILLITLLMSFVIGHSIIVLVISKGLLKSQSQGTSLFTSAASSQRGCAEISNGDPSPATKRREGEESRGAVAVI